MKGKYSQFFLLIKEANSKGASLTKEQAVSDFTGGRTQSLKDLSHWDVQELCRQLQRMNGSQPTPYQAHSPDEKMRDKMRKGIIAHFKNIGRTTTDAIAWAERYGTGGQKKNFNDYNQQELWQLLRNAEKVKNDFIQAINKSACRTTEETS